MQKSEEVLAAEIAIERFILSQLSVLNQNGIVVFDAAIDICGDSGTSIVSCDLKVCPHESRATF